MCVLCHIRVNPVTHVPEGNSTDAERWYGAVGLLRARETVWVASKSIIELKCHYRSFCKGNSTSLVSGQLGSY